MPDLRHAAMEAAFQADLDGVFEYLTRVQSNVPIELLQDAVQATLKYYDRSVDACIALGKVLFRAWHFKDVSRTDFSVSRYQRGITTDELLALMDLNNLFTHIMSDIYLLPPEDAIIILQEWMKLDKHHGSRFMVHYMRIANILSDDQDFINAVAFLTTGRLLISQQDSCALEKALAEQLNQCRGSRKIHLLRVKDMCSLNSTRPIQDIMRKSSKRRRICVDIQVERRPTGIKEQWGSCKNKGHQAAFIFLCEQLQRVTRPYPSLPAKECTNNEATLPDQVYNDIHSKLDGKTDPLSRCKKRCLQAIYEQQPGWRSILKLMVQFTDLWIDEWLHPNSTSAFVKIIRDNHLVIDCYHNSYKAVYRIPSEKWNKYKVDRICLFFRSLVESIDEKNELLAVRDYVFQHMAEYHGMEYDFFNGLPVMDVNGELTRVLNQCVKKRENAEWDHAINGLAVLSVFCPYKVVSGILSECVTDQDKQKTMIPVLRQLGGLCKLGVERDGKVTTIFGHYLQSLVSESDLRFLHANAPTIASLIGVCSSTVKAPFAEYPCVLLPRDHVRVSNDVLFDPTDFIADVIPLLLSTQDDQWTISGLALRILDAMYGDDKTQHKKFGGSSIVQQSILSCAAPIGLCLSLTEILDMRNTQGQSSPPPIQQFETALSLLRTTFVALAEGTEMACLSSSDVDEVLLQLETDYDWKTRMLWSDFQFMLQLRQDSSKAKLSIPRLLEPMVHTLDNTCYHFGKGSASQEDCWDTLFNACKISSAFTDLLFSSKDVWRTSMQSICRHPMENTIVTDNLYRSLFPYMSLSVYVEYEQLLVKFLGHLYQSFDAYRMVIDFPYSNESLRPFAKMLSDPDAKIFWIVLHCTSLLKQKCPTDASRSNHAYFVTNIIRILQIVHSWANPFPPDPRKPSLRSMRDSIYTDPCVRMNVSGIYDDEDQRLEDYDIDHPSACAKSVVVIDVFYPLYNDQMRSRKALSLLTLCLLCESTTDTDSDDEMNKSIRVLLLQIMEGLRDSRRRQGFHELAATQMKSRLVGWRKARGEKRRSILRPILTESEEMLVESYLSVLGPNRSAGMLELLQEDLQESSNRKKSKKKSIIFCLPPKNIAQSTQ